jgi:hypothetical protein
VVFKAHINEQMQALSKKDSYIPLLLKHRREEKNYVWLLQIVMMQSQLKVLNLMNV